MRLAETENPVIPGDKLPELNELQLSDEVRNEIISLHWTPYQELLLEALLPSAPNIIALPEHLSLDTQLSYFRSALENAGVNANLYKVRNFPRLFALAERFEQGEMIVLSGEHFNINTASFLRENLALLLRIAQFRDGTLHPLFTPLRSKIISLLAETKSVLVPIKDFKNIDNFQKMGVNDLQKLQNNLNLIKKTLRETLGVVVNFYKKDDYIQVIFENDIELGSLIVPHDIIDQFPTVPIFVLNKLFGYRYGKKKSTFSYSEKEILKDLIQAQLDGTKVVGEQTGTYRVAILEIRRKVASLFKETNYELEVQNSHGNGYTLLIKRHGRYLEPFSLK